MSYYLVLINVILFRETVFFRHKTKTPFIYPFTGNRNLNSIACINTEHRVYQKRTTCIFFIL